MRDYVIINGIKYEYFETDGIIKASKDGDPLGIISVNEGDWELILNGADPIKDGWEDGLGNSLSYDGWGSDF
nr:MAG TPA: hypothetical protein [Caudoviricetes sp.]